ncbi:MAG TPA: DUF4962 domain-containing protein [Phycisphaerae bacterium]|nr:DUF4962 domain-containing protein [Phycisphaerae bacterium]
MSMPSTRPAAPVRFGSEAILPDDSRTHFSRAVNFAPADGEVCTLNPPRFRWQYHPTEPGQGGDYVFTFQIAADRDFDSNVLKVETEFNFYNTIAPLQGTGPFYWRIGYRDRTASGPPTHWGDVRSFTLPGDAEVWDRSALAKPDFAAKPHPRMLFNAETLPKLRKLVETHDDSRVIFEGMLAEADRVLQAKWWAHMPESDREKTDVSYLTIAGDLALVAFCWRVTGDDRYAGVLERAVRFARYPKGGGASPEGAGGDSNEDSTQTTEFLALLYDWLYQDLSEPQRRDFADSLDWRIDHFVNYFAWRRVRDDKQQVWRHSLSTDGASHGIEGFYDTFPAAIAAYQESAHARECFHLGVNYMVGVGSSHGMESGSNEGPGYGNSKLAWMVNAACYLDSVFPEFGIGRNPWLMRVGAFYRAQTPVGIQHAPWGHGSNRRSYFEDGHAKSYRKLAFLTGDGRFLANYRHYGSVGADMMRPWIECALPLWREAPAPSVEEPGVQLFGRAGWVMAHSGPPSDPDTYRRGVGMIFPCRPVGAYSHAFNCDNSFHIFGYGQDLSHAAGSSDYEPHAFHAMSHNTILVDGLGQAQPGGLQEVPYYSRIIAFAAPNDSVAYWCGDATLAYPRRPFQPRHWWGRLSEVYQKRDLSYVRRVNRHVLFVRRKYFVILDDLAADRPARWSWLYHILPDGSLELDRTTGSFRYNVGGVGVHVAHLLGAGQLDVQDLRGADGFRNPLTGEDYAEDFGRGRRERPFVAEHNLWLTTREAHRTWRFLAVVYPVPQGGKAPAIQRLDELTVRVTAGDEVDVISFGPASAQPATINVDLPAIAPAGLH